MSRSTDASGWRWEVVGFVGSLVLAGLTRAVRSYQRRRSETWPISFGHILGASAEEKDKQILLKAPFSYRVDSESYGGTFKKTFVDIDEANAWAEALRGKQVAVRYDPNKPSRSQVWESDLQTIVQASGFSASSHRPEPAELPGWERVMVTLGFVLALFGTVFAIGMVIAAVAGRPLAPHTLMYSNLGAFALLILAGLEGWKGGKGVAHTAPEWMKYLGYAVLYYTIFSSVLLPRIRTNPASAPQRTQRESAVRSANFQLLIYFGALEAFYGRLNAGRKREDLQPSLG